MTVRTLSQADVDALVAYEFQRCNDLGIQPKEWRSIGEHTMEWSAGAEIVRSIAVLPLIRYVHDGVLENPFWDTDAYLFRRVRATA